jgi:hypothetical protein
LGTGTQSFSAPICRLGDARGFFLAGRDDVSVLGKFRNPRFILVDGRAVRLQRAVSAMKRFGLLPKSTNFQVTSMITG